MVRPVVATQSKVLAAAPEVLYELLPALPPDQVYRRWYWVIPPIRQVIYTDGEWRRVGQKRSMILAGGSAVAEVVRAEPPAAFGYRLTEMTGLLAPLLRQVDGRVDLRAVEGGTGVTWQWTMHPRTWASVLPVRVFAALWPRWAMKALNHLDEQATTRGR